MAGGRSCLLQYDISVLSSKTRWRARFLNLRSRIMMRLSDRCCSSMRVTESTILSRLNGAECCAAGEAVVYVVALTMKSRVRWRHLDETTHRRSCIAWWLPTYPYRNKIFYDKYLLTPQTLTFTNPITLVTSARQLFWQNRYCFSGACFHPRKNSKTND